MVQSNEDKGDVLLVMVVNCIHYRMVDMADRQVDVVANEKVFIFIVGKNEDKIKVSVLKIVSDNIIIKENHNEVAELQR